MKPVASSLDNKSAKLNIRKQLKYMRKNELEPSEIIDTLENALKGSYQVNRANPMKIIMKVDKKATEADVVDIIRNAIPNDAPTDKIDIHTMFRIHLKDGKVTITAKRLNER